MRVNVFEGSRRISAVIGIGLVVGFFSYAAFNDPQSRVSVVYNGPVAAPVLGTDCGDDSADKFVYQTPPSWQGTELFACFRAYKASDDRRLVPYKGDADMRTWMLDSPYSRGVRDHIEDRLASFPYDSYVAEAQAAKRRARLNQWKSAALGLAGFLIGGWLTAFTIGWVVRGFMGIPPRKDVRPTI